MLLNTYVRMRTLLVCRKGQSLMEYALILALIAVVLIGILTTLGGNIKEKLSYISTKLVQATPGD